MRFTHLLAVLAFFPLLSCRKDSVVLTGSGQLGFEKTYGGSGDELGKATIETPEGNYVVTGSTTSWGNGLTDGYLLMTDHNGELIWQKTFGGSGAEGFNNLVRTPDGGFLVLGASTSFGSGLNDFYLVKTDASGNQQWSQAYGGSDHDIGIGICATSDGNYLLAGMTASYGSGPDDIWLLKVDPNGTVLWNKTYGGSSGEWGYGVTEMSGAYYLFGHTESYGSGDRDFYLLKLNTSGDTLWTRTYGGSGYEQSSTIYKTASGELLLCGHSASFGHPEHNLFAVKVNASGTLLWQLNYGGTYHDGGECGIEIAGNFYLAGRSDSFGNHSENMYLVKADISGNNTSELNFGGQAPDAAYSIIETNTSLLLTGNTSSYGKGNNDIYLVRTPR